MTPAQKQDKLMWMGRLRIGVWGLVVSLIVVGGVGACGMFLPPSGYEVDPVGARVVIWHDGQTETLIVSTSFRGNAKDFAWIIPVPARPEVTAGKDELFTALEDYTRPKVPDEYPQPLGMGRGVPAVQMEDAVTVYETKQVDIYDISVLSATDKTELVKWLTKNGYEYPTNREHLLSGYINKGWYFVVAKVSEEAAGFAGTYLQEGHATPLKIVFASKQIIYPLKISGPAATGGRQTPTSGPFLMEGQGAEVSVPTTVGPQGVAIGEVRPEYDPGFVPPSQGRPWPVIEALNMVVYVFADKKQTAPGWNTEYAGYVPAKEIERLAYEESGEPWMKTSKRRYLTKLTRRMRPAEITDDVVIREAKDNKPVGGGSGTEWERWWRPVVVLGVPVVAELAVIGYIIYRKRRHV